MQFWSLLESSNQILCRMIDTSTCIRKIWKLAMSPTQHHSWSRVHTKKNSIVNGDEVISSGLVQFKSLTKRSQKASVLRAFHPFATDNWQHDQLCVWACISIVHHWHGTMDNLSLLCETASVISIYEKRSWKVRKSIGQENASQTIDFLRC